MLCTSAGVRGTAVSSRCSPPQALMSSSHESSTCVACWLQLLCTSSVTLLQAFVSCVMDDDMDFLAGFVRNSVVESSDSGDCDFLGGMVRKRKRAPRGHAQTSQRAKLDRERCCERARAGKDTIFDYISFVSDHVSNLTALMSSPGHQLGAEPPCFCD